MGGAGITDSDFADHAITGGFATRAELEGISAAFRRWTDRPDGFWAFLHGEVLAVRPVIRCQCQVPGVRGQFFRVRLVIGEWRD